MKQRYNTDLLEILNYGSFLIKCLQKLSNVAYIWGVSLRLPDLACPTEVGRPYLHLLADH